MQIGINEPDPDLNRIVALVSLISLELSYLIFSTISFAEYLGIAVTSNVGLYLGILYPVLTGLFWILLFYFSKRDVLRDSRDEVRHMIRYPKYRWDVWTFFTVTPIMWIITVALIWSFLASFGFDPTVDFSNPIGSEKLDRFQTAHFLVGITGLASFFLGIRLTFAYGFYEYHLRNPTFLEKKITEMEPNIRPLREK